MDVIAFVTVSTSIPSDTGRSGRYIRGARYTLFSGLPCSSRKILNESAEAMISKEPDQWSGEAFIDLSCKAASLIRNTGWADPEAVASPCARQYPEYCTAHTASTPSHAPE